MDLISCLFETNALKVSKYDKPFIYKNNDMGPYIYKMHHLFGSENAANKLLAYINDNKNDKQIFTIDLLKIIKEKYSTDSIYNYVINHIKENILRLVDISKIDFISGGERRDWFFSLMIANLLGKQHLTIYKDLDIMKFDFVGVQKVLNLHNASIMHITDNLVKGDTYKKFWLPATKKISGKIKWGFTVANRMHAGDSVLKENGIDSYSLIKIEQHFFDEVMKLGFIDKNQYNMLIEFIENEEKSKKNLKKMFYK